MPLCADVLCRAVCCQVEDTGPKEWVSFLKPNITISMVDHFVAYPKTNIPPPVSPQHSNNIPLQFDALPACEECVVSCDDLLAALSGPHICPCCTLPELCCILQNSCWGDISSCAAAVTHSRLGLLSRPCSIL